MAPTLTQALKRRGMTFPRTVRPIMDSIGEDPQLMTGIDAMRARERRFTDERTAMLAGIALHDPSRRHFDAMLDDAWTAAPPARRNEVVIGGGLHAAIYCAIRVARGFTRPLVLEAAERAGGAMAVSRESAFWLNSRNRPGPLGVPGQLASLNVLPGAPVQPSDISGDDYQSNRDLAWVIRTTLAMNAAVATGQQVASIETRSGEYRYRLVGTDGGTIVSANRVVMALGLGVPRALSVSGTRVESFPQFMARMDNPFPLQGLSRVAVIGAGDSGKTVIEALTGKGPTTRWSVASLDWPTTIDWYGCPSADCKTWEADNRSRYRGIGVLLGQEGSPGRVTPKPRAQAYAEGYGAVYVNGSPYDLVINCTGFGAVTPDNPWTFAPATTGGLACSRNAAGQDVHQIGPGINLPFSADETKYQPSVVANAENETALFRWADRTAAFSASLPAPKAQSAEKAARAVRAMYDALGTRAVKEAPRSLDDLGRDSNGVTIRVGDTVESTAGRCVVLGPARESPGLIVVSAAGGYSVNTDITARYGARPSKVTVDLQSRVSGAPLALDYSNWPIRVGAYVTCRGEGPYRVLGTTDLGTIALAGPGGGYTRNDEPVFGGPPNKLSLAPAPVIMGGERVRVFGSSRYSTTAKALYGTIVSAGERPTIELDGGRNDAYTPSYDRIAVLPTTRDAEKPRMEFVDPRAFKSLKDPF